MSGEAFPLLKTYTQEVRPTLFGRQCRPEEGRVVFVGAPFDSTTSRIPGQRLAPRKIREASMELETFDPVTGRDSEEAEYCDAGDIPLVVDYRVLTEILGSIAREVFASGKILAVWRPLCHFPRRKSGNRGLRQGSASSLRCALRPQG